MRNAEKTPEELRAEAINTALDRIILERKQIKPAKDEQPPPRFNGYIIALGLALTINATIYLLLTGPRSTKTEPPVKYTPSTANTPTHPTVIPTKATPPPVMPVATVAKTTLQIERKPSQTPRTEPHKTLPEKKTTQIQRNQTEDETLNQHRAAAYRYALKQKGLFLNITSTEPVSGWDGRYRTEGTLERDRFGRIPNAQNCEILTQEENGIVNGIDITLKY